MTIRKMLVAAVLASVTVIAGAQAIAAEGPPQFKVDASWPKQLPNNWILGQIGGMTVDAQDHIWVFQRPRSLNDADKGATLTPKRSRCCAPAPSVMEFDADGNLIQAWGGPGYASGLAGERTRHPGRLQEPGLADGQLRQGRHSS